MRTCNKKTSKNPTNIIHSSNSYNSPKIPPIAITKENNNNNKRVDFSPKPN